MATRVRSYSKINLGLSIGPVRGDGCHELVTLYQTLELHDVVSVAARAAAKTRILLQSNDSRVPTDGRNTAYKMVERALGRLGLSAEVEIHIQKNLPIQGGMGAGSANAAAALIGLERELGVVCPDRLEIAAEVGSDVPLFLVGGAVLGTNRGEVVQAVEDRDFGGVACVIALPRVGVSTPQAFRDWDARYSDPALRNEPVRDTLDELSRIYASVFASRGDQNVVSGTSGIVPDPKSPEQYQSESGTLDGLAENSLLALVRTGIENDFEQVVFLQYPSLRAIKRQLMGSETDEPAVYAALSGSGSALFGLYRSEADAQAAQRRVQTADFGVPVQVLHTRTLPREAYWRGMIAE